MKTWKIEKGTVEKMESKETRLFYNPEDLTIWARNADVLNGDGFVVRYNAGITKWSKANILKVVNYNNKYCR